MAKQFFIDKRPHNGLTYEQYLDIMKAFSERTDIDPEDDLTRQRVEFTKLNLHRSLRINRTYTVSDDFCKYLAKITTPQLWMVISEVWCGDSCQSLPLIAKFAECNENVTLRILQRDENLDIMDHYLTNGSRSIPILVIFDEQGNELAQWGPRPKPAAELYAREKAKGLDKDAINASLQLWYSRDRGKAIEKEFLELFERVTSDS